MRKYLLEIKPLEPYTFGEEKGFTFKGVDQNNSYLMTSKKMPEQTTVIGMVRYLVLESRGLVRSNFSYSADEQKKMAELTGSYSFAFDPNEEQSFGVIREISPLFILDRNQNIYIKNPFCNIFGNLNEQEQQKENQPLRIMKMRKEGVHSSEGTVCFPEADSETGYDNKKGYGRGFLCITENKAKTNDTTGADPLPRLLNEWDVFETKMISGNKKTREEDAFFKRETVVLKNDMLFGVYVTVEDTVDLTNRNYLVYMGKKKSLFKVAATPVDMSESLEGRAKAYFDQYLSKSEPWQYCLSDVFVRNGVDAYKDFSIVETKTVRNLETTFSRDGEYVRRKKKRYQLIAAGSVFYKEEPDAFKITENDNIKNNTLYNMGFNHMIQIGGNQ